MTKTLPCFASEYFIFLITDSAGLSRKAPPARWLLDILECSDSVVNRHPRNRTGRWWWGWLAASCEAGSWYDTRRLFRCLPMVDASFFDDRT